MVSCRYHPNPTRLRGALLTAAELLHVFQALVKHENGASIIAYHFETELVAWARHAAQVGCERCTDLVGRFDEIIPEGSGAVTRDRWESYPPLRQLLDEIASHVTLESDLRGWDVQGAQDG